MLPLEEGHSVTHDVRETWTRAASELLELDGRGRSGENAPDTTKENP